MTPVTTILHVEDSSDDAFLLGLAVKKAKTGWGIKHALDGQEAINYLGGTGQFSNRDLFPFPSLVLLDLKLPKADGFEVLAWARSQPEIKDLPIIILSGSVLEEDRARCHGLGSTAYFAKTPAYEDVMLFIERLLLPLQIRPLNTIPHALSA
jgi:CheY-like chemotaxis protein